MRDATWVMFNKRLIEATQEQNWKAISIIYYEMAERVSSEGTNAEYLRDQGYKAKLRHHQESLDNPLICAVEIQVNANACVNCISQAGVIIHAEDARLINPIPVKDCLSSEGCRCTYLPVID